MLARIIENSQKDNALTSSALAHLPGTKRWAKGSRPQEEPFVGDSPVDLSVPAWPERLVFALLFVNLLFDMATWGFENRALPVLIHMALLAASWVLVMLARPIRLEVEDLILLAFLGYLAVLLPYSSDIVLSANYYFKVVLSSLFLMVGRATLGTPSGVQLLLTAFPPIFLIYLAYTGLANYFQWGDVAYVGQNLWLGFIGFESQFQLALGVALIPVIVRQYSSAASKAIVTVLGIAIAFYLLLVFRRTNFIIVGLGYLGILVIGTNRRRSLAFLFGAAFFGAVLFPLYSEFLSQNLEIRQSRFQDAAYYYLEEGRAVEFQLVVETLSGQPLKVLFGGGELFNEAGRYGFQALDESNYTRPLHTDYARLLFGGGIVGVALYVTFIAVIFLKFLTAFLRSVGGSPAHEYSSLGLTLTALVAVVGFSSGITYISYRLLMMLLLGSLLGTLSKQTVSER